ncbi:MAG: L,D-transpeptidase family protein [Candidatus Competibacteraceae bacterium]
MFAAGDCHVPDQVPKCSQSQTIAIGNHRGVIADDEDDINHFKSPLPVAGLTGYPMVHAIGHPNPPLSRLTAFIMKFRILLSITLVLATINGAIMVYRFLRPPPSGSPIDRPPTDQTTPAVAQPSTPASDPDQVPEQSVPVEKHAMLSPQPPPRLSSRIADRVLVEKNARRLTLFRNNRPIKSYEIALGRQPVGAKQFEGDNKTPEGHYVIDFRKRNSSYHRLAHLLSRSQEAAFAASRNARPAATS